VNATLEQHSPDYIERYGRVGSDKWWNLYDRGRISRTVLCGQIVHVGPTLDDFGEECTFVRIQTDRDPVEYDLEDFWEDQAVQLGQWIQIERAKTVVLTNTGPITTHIDVKITLADEGA
jgi:hypothetical protein